MPNTSRSNAAPLIPEEVRKIMLRKAQLKIPRYKPPGRRKRAASNGRFA
jgi:hypothetical protein